MNKQIIVTAALLGAVAVIAGAFGAHALKAVLTPPQLETWHTAVQYHFYHVFALLFLATLNTNQNAAFTAYWLFAGGILLFSGSLYLLSCKDAWGWPWLRFMGPVTPIGGLLFIAGWISMAVAAFKR